MTTLKESTIWISYLRSFITVLVVFHHANLAYTTFAYFNKEVYINSTHPVVDTQRWIGLDILVSFNDIYFMSLMFLIGGLFLVKSISKKGQQKFIIDRLKRLFIPFLVLGTFFMLIAYIPSYFLSNGNWNLKAYVVDYFTVQSWPVGPPWFIWLLFTFNLFFAITYKPLVKSYEVIGVKMKGLSSKPWRLVLLFIICTAVLYIPISYQLGVNKWTGFGPFDFQLNRLFLYAGFFWIGIFLGSFNFNNTLLFSVSKLVKQWKLFWLIALFVFVSITLIPSYLTKLVTQNKVDEFYTWMLYYFVYVLSICFTSLAMLTSFKALVKKENSLWNSLTENAYMIYLCHYPIITWIQFLLLKIEVHASLKAMLTFIVSFILSWLLSIQLRKLAIFRKYI